ncbi:MAG: HlyD family efflux transporter periplasmic adaptor subunit [Gammaproteobacteria bacterium]|nr:HlyD family efflux transporter periplasmic adaptor subunit [Gammaproteobacteria bacterium]
MITDNIAKQDSSQSDTELSQQDLLAAYRSLEERNIQLEHSLKHGRRWLWISIIVLVLLLTAIDVVHWWWLDTQYGHGTYTSQSLVTETQSEDTSTAKLLTVKSQPVSKHLGLVGRLAAGSTVNVTAPFDSKIMSLEFSFGELVEKGQRLLQLDIADLDSEMRTAQISQAQAQEELDVLLAWTSNSEVTSAQRTLELAQHKLVGARKKKEFDDKLFKEGVISQDELTGSSEQLHSYKNALVAAQEALEVVLDQGSEKHVKLAKMKLENENYKLETIKDEIAGSQILAPLSGVALRVNTGESDTASSISVGSPVRAQQMLLSIGDMDSLKVDVSVSELDINDIKPGLKVVIAADNFKQKTLPGKVSAVGSQVDASGNQDMAYYPVTVAVQSPPADVKEYIRLGMHVRLDIIVYDNPDGVVIPRSAVHGDSGDYSVMRLDKQKNKLISTSVEVGHSLANGIEILSGLTPGDRIAP